MNLSIFSNIHYYTACNFLCQDIIHTESTDNISLLKINKFTPLEALQ